MKLTNTDRILLSTILPAEGKYEDLICIKDIKQKVSPTQQEVKSWKITTTPENKITWSPNTKTYDIKFTAPEIAIIGTSLQKLSKDEKLTESLISLYKMFVIG